MTPVPEPADDRRLPSVSADVYGWLRSAIVSGEYRPNQRLIETELAERLEASRTPIREALQRLHSEGLVAVHRRGWIVRDHSASDIEEIYDVRMALEGYAARLATQRASDAQLQEIRALDDAMAVADRADFVDLHDGFHEGIVAASGNPMLGDLVKGYRDHPFNRRVAGRYGEEELRIATEGHHRLTAALLARDPDTAELAMREHLRTALGVTLRLIG